MGADDAGHARGREGAAAGAARRRPHRPLVTRSRHTCRSLDDRETTRVMALKPITVVVTASGAPGTAALLRGLRENGEREVRLVGTDMSERSVGRHLCDAFHLVPAGSDPGFADAIRAIVEREGADCVLPQSSFDLEGLAAHRDAVPGARARLGARHDLPLERQGRDVRVPAPARPAGAGVPARQRRGRGRGGGARARLPGRPGLLQARLLLRLARLPRSSTRPSTAPTSCSTSGPARWRCGSRRRSSCCPPEGGPDLLVMELATGGERTIDGIADGERILLGHAKTREAMRAGLAMYFVTLDDAALMEIADRIVAELADRALLQHPARRRPRDRDQPAHLDDRLPGGPEPPLPRRQARPG